MSNALVILIAIPVVLGVAYGIMRLWMSLINFD